MNYYNIVTLNEVLEDFYGAKTVLLISSRTADLSDEYDKSLVEAFPITLTEIENCMYIWDETYTVKQLKHELEISPSWKLSAELLVEDNDYEEDLTACDDETEEISDESSLLEETVAKTTEVEDEETEVEAEENPEETAETDEEASVPTSTKLTIKDWNDLKSVEVAYSYIKNYFNLYGPNPLLRRMDGIPLRNLLEILEKEGIVDNETIDAISKVLDINERMNSGTATSFNGPVECALVANGCKEKIVKNIKTVYTAGIDFYNDLYTYWMSLLCVSDVSRAKAMMKTTMDYATSKTKSSKELFEFEVVDIPNEIKNFTATSPKVVGTQWKVIDVEKEVYGYKTSEKYILIETNEDEIDEEILATLKVRGLVMDNVPLFKFPTTVSDIKDVRRLLSGIIGLTEYGIEDDEIIAEATCSCGSSCGCSDTDGNDYDEEFENHEEIEEEYDWDEEIPDEEEYDESEGIPTMLSEEDFINLDDLED